MVFSPTVGCVSNVFDTDRIVTVPNVLSVLRLVGIPIFLWLLLHERNVELAVCVLAVASLTDFLDGFIARTFHQRSPVGRILDPLVDRAYIVSTLIGLAVREIVPWWFVGLLFARDALLAVLWLVFRSFKIGSHPVHIVGKAGTFALLVAIPSLLLGATSWPSAWLFSSMGWVLGCVGAILYWWAGVIYVQYIRVAASVATSKVA